MESKNLLEAISWTFQKHSKAYLSIGNLMDAPWERQIFSNSHQLLTTCQVPEDAGPLRL
jgi:hypothetical protein